MNGIFFFGAVLVLAANLSLNDDSRYLFFQPGLSNYHRRSSVPVIPHFETLTAKLGWLFISFCVLKIDVV